MSWASSEWKVGLPAAVQVKISEMETQLEKLHKEKQQKQLQIERLEAVVESEKKKHDEEKGKLQSVEKEVMQLNSNSDEKIRQLMKAQQDLLIKERHMMNFQNQIDALKRQYDQELSKSKQLEFELQQQKINTHSSFESSEITSLNKKITELEGLRTKQDELIKQLENREETFVYGQAGDHANLEETIQKLEKECEGLKVANSKLELELWNKNKCDNESAIGANRCNLKIQNEVNKLQNQLDETKIKITEYELKIQALEQNWRDCEAAHISSVQCMKDKENQLRTEHTEQIAELKKQLAVTEAFLIQEKKNVAVIKTNLEELETKHRALEKENEELRQCILTGNSAEFNEETQFLKEHCHNLQERLNLLQSRKTSSDDDMDPTYNIEHLQELLDEKEMEIKSLTKSQKEAENQFKLLQEKLNCSEELIMSLNTIVIDHNTKCVDTKQKLECYREDINHKIETVQILETEKKQLKKSIQAKDSLIQALVNGDGECGKSILKNRVAELRLMCEDYESKIQVLVCKLQLLQNELDSKMRGTYPAEECEFKDLELELLKVKEMKLQECVQELNTLKEHSEESHASTSLCKKLSEKESQLTTVMYNLDKVSAQLQSRERELKDLKQHYDQLEADYKVMAAQLESSRKEAKYSNVAADVNHSQIEVMRNELMKKDKLIRHLQNEMNSLQTITLQIEDFQRSIRERDERIFQLETELDSEQRMKEERGLAMHTLQNKVKSLQTELDEKDATMSDMRNVNEENEMAMQYLRTIQSNMQTELQEKDNQCSVFQLELTKIQNVFQETESGNRTLQCQVEELKNRYEKFLLDKEEADNTINSLQMELFTLKSDLQSAHKNVEKIRDKLEYKTNEIVALSVELEKKERHIISQQIQLDKLLRSHEEQDACIHSLMSRLTTLQSDIEEKEKSSGIFSLQPDFMSSKTTLNPKVLQAELWAMKSQLEGKEKQLEKARLHLEERDGSIQFLRTLLVTLQNDLEEREKLVKSLQQQLNTCQENLKRQEMNTFDLQKQLKAASRDVEEKVTKINSLLNDIEITHRDQEDKKTRIQNLRSQMHTMQTKLEGTLKEKEEKKSTISVLRSQIQSLQNKIQLAQKDREDKRACIQALQSELQVLQDEVDVSRKVNDKKEHKIQVLNSQLGSVKGELEEREKIINTLHGEMALLRSSDQEKDATLDKLTLQLQSVQSKFEKSNLAIHSLQNEVESLKAISFKTPKEILTNLSPGNKTFESHVQMLVSEMESWQYKLQSSQSEWEEKEDIFHALANQVHKLQAKLEEKRDVTDNLEKELDQNSDQTKECRHRCLVMEIQLLQDELESKEAALMEATQHLRQTGEQKHQIEQEVNKLLVEMEEIQQEHEKSIQAVNADGQERREQPNDSQWRQLQLQIVQANSRIEIMMSDAEEMRNAMEILEFEKLELQESQEGLICENQALRKEIAGMEMELQRMKKSSPITTSSCPSCAEYAVEINYLKEGRDSSVGKIKDLELALMKANQDIESLCLRLDSGQVSLMNRSEDRCKSSLDFGSLKKDDVNAIQSARKAITLEFKTEMSVLHSNIETVYVELFNELKDECNMRNLSFNFIGCQDSARNQLSERFADSCDILALIRQQHRYLVVKVVEILQLLMDRSQAMEAKNCSESGLRMRLERFETDNAKLSEILSDKLLQLETTLKSLESLTDRVVLLEKEKNDGVTRIAALEKEKENVDKSLQEAKIEIEISNKSREAMAASLEAKHEEENSKLLSKISAIENENSYLLDILADKTISLNDISLVVPSLEEKLELIEIQNYACCQFAEEEHKKHKLLEWTIYEEIYKFENSSQGKFEDRKNIDQFDINQLKEKLGGVSKAFSDKEKDLANLREKMAVRDEESEKKEKQIAEIAEEKMNLTLKLNEQTEKMAVRDEEAEKKEKQIAEIAEEKMSLTLKLNEQTEKMMTTENELTQLKSRFYSELNMFEEEKAHFLKTISEKQVKCEDETAKVCQLEQEIYKLKEDETAKVCQLEQEICKLKEEICKLKEDETAKVCQLEQEICKLKEDETAKVCQLEQEICKLKEDETAKVCQLEQEICKLKEDETAKVCQLEQEICNLKDDETAKVCQLEQEICNLKEAEADTCEKIEELKMGIEKYRNAEEDRNSTVNNLLAKLKTSEEERKKLVDNLNQNLKSLEQKKSQLNSIRLEVKQLKREKEQSIGVIKDNEEILRELEHKFKKTQNEYKLKCDSHHRLELAKTECTKLIVALTDQVAELESGKSERGNKISQLEKEMTDSERRFGESKNRLKSQLLDTVRKFDSEKVELCDKYNKSLQELREQLEEAEEELREKLKEAEEELKCERDDRAKENAANKAKYEEELKCERDDRAKENADNKAKYEEELKCERDDRCKENAANKAKYEEELKCERDDRCKENAANKAKYEEELKCERDDRVKENAANKAKYEVDLKERVDALTLTIQQLQLEKADFLLTTTERISELEDETKKLCDKLADEESKVEENSRWNVELKSKIEILETANSKLLEIACAKEEEAKELRHELMLHEQSEQRVVQALEEKRVAAASLEEQVKRLESEKKVIAAGLDQSAIQFDQLKRLYDVAAEDKVKSQTDMHKLSELIRELGNEKKGLEDKLRETLCNNRQKLSDLNRERNEALMEVNSMTEKQVECMLEVNRLKGEILSLKHQVDNLQEENHYLIRQVDQISKETARLEENKKELLDELRQGKEDSAKLCEQIFILKSQLQQRQNKEKGTLDELQTEQVRSFDSYGGLGDDRLHGGESMATIVREQLDSQLTGLTTDLHGLKSRHENLQCNYEEACHHAKNVEEEIGKISLMRSPVPYKVLSDSSEVVPKDEANSPTNDN